MYLINKQIGSKDFWKSIKLKENSFASDNMITSTKIDKSQTKPAH